MRASGILMPIFSLPSRYGIGTLGKKAYDFVDFLQAAGQSYWQILPIGPTSYGDSPYQSFSSFAGNPYFIDIEMLIDDGFLTQDEADSAFFGSNPCRVDYGALYENRLALLSKAFARFVPDSEYYDFCRNNGCWLREYSLFMVIKEQNGGVAWLEWDAPLRSHDKHALELVAEKYSEEIEFYNFVQFMFWKQWYALKSYANERGIRIIGDIPIYVALDSADVWSEREQFLLLPDGHPSAVAGCPPDAFSKDGQLWGNPLYNWERMKSDRYAWWKRRMGFSLGTYDLVRIDHFRGFDSFYSIPSGDKTARGGSWKKGPGMDLFSALFADFGDNMPIIAEDLGFLTPSVRRLLADTGFPGMKVLQFAFDTREESDYLPHNYTRNCVVYTGTHDNDTIMGWTSSAPSSDVAAAKKYMHVAPDEGFNWAMIRTAMMSVADTAIFMMPDFLGLGSLARLNTPSTVGGNWNWRFEDGCINYWLAGIIREQTALYGRLPNREPEKEIYET